jgi:hypothetical protein
MKKILFYLMVITALNFSFLTLKGQVLDVPKTIQEHSMWCWDASSVCVLNWYGFIFTQCEIADWAFSRSDCCGEPAFDWRDLPDHPELRHPCNSGNYLAGHSNHDVDDILDHYGSITSSIVERALTSAELITEMGEKTPFVMRFDWTGGGAHALVGHGIVGDDVGGYDVYYMDPWPGNGFTINDYDFVVASDGHNWTRTLTLTTLPGGNDFYVLNPWVTQSCSSPGGLVDVSCDQLYAGSQTDAGLGNVNLGYYLRRSGSTDPSTYILLGSDPSSLGTDDRSNSETAALTIPLTTTAGYYEILFMADYDNLFVETNESNNTLGFTLWIDAIKPSLSCPANAERPNDPGVCTYTVPGTAWDATATDDGVVKTLTWVMSGTTTGSGENSIAGKILNKGVTTVTWTATDECGNVSTCQQEITVVDNQPPTLICGTNASKPADPDVCSYTVTGTLLDATATDNCEMKSLTWVLSGATELSGSTTLNGTTFQLGPTTVTWTAEDKAGNKSSCTQTITVFDSQPPVITCKPDAIKTSDEGECTYTTVGAEFDATATDNCGLKPLTWELSGATTGSGSLTLEGVEFYFGETAVTWTAEDPSGNSSSCEMLVDVNKIITKTTVTTDLAQQQYSDPVEFTATIQPGTCTGAGQAATHVTFYVGEQPMGDPVPLVLDGGLLTASETYPLLDYPGFEGTMNPDPAVNPKLVTAQFSGIDEDFEVKDATTNLTVIPENGCAYYAGVYYASTGSALLEEATVVLATTIVEEDDGYPGEFLNNTMVRFNDSGSPITSVPALNAGEIGAGPAIGTASYEWTGVDVDVYDITVAVMGYYSNAELDGCSGEALVTVGKPSPDFITGGGFVTLENSMGLLAGSPGTKNNFGFIVKYNRKMTNLQGNLNTIFRRMEDDGMHLYKIKSNVLSSLAINENQATFTGKANIQDITDPLNVGDVAGNCILQFTLTDNGEPGTADLISITVWKSDGGMWFTTHWDGIEYRPAEKLLDGGNLVVNSGDDDEGGTKPPKKKTGTINVLNNSTLHVFPNPFSDRLFFDFTPSADLPALLEVFDASGRKLATLLNRNVIGGVNYKIEYRPLNGVNHLLIYRLILGNQTFNGKVFYQQ